MLEPVAVLARIGYLSEEPDLPGWMRVGELLRYTQAFYPRCDTTYAEHLRHQFALDPDVRVTTLSKGQRARLGLIVAEAHRPELLILDEPSSALEPFPPPARLFPWLIYKSGGLVRRGGSRGEPPHRICWSGRDCDPTSAEAE
jgi:ABC-type molybdate transport system ATPase subunit